MPIVNDYSIAVQPIAFGNTHPWRLVGLGILCAIPLVLFGFPHPAHDTFWHLKWWHNFSAQFWQGELYPRWLPEINYGLGSPAFFYYPPLAYWVGALFAPLAGAELPGWRALGWSSALALVLSGLTALACFRKLAPARPALVAAVVYMLAPYHLAIDLLERGAYAEHWAFVWMPLAIRGVIGMRDRERHAFLLAAGAFGGLFLTHTPSTVTFTPLALLYALGVDAGRLWTNEMEGRQAAAANSSGSKSEIRNPRPERSPNAEIRNDQSAGATTNDPSMAAATSARSSGFGFRSSFGLRISDFGFPPNLRRLLAAGKGTSPGGWMFPRTVGAVLVGCGLAAVYLLPALTTQSAVSTQYLRTAYEQTFFFPTLDLARPLSTPDPFNQRLLFCLAGLVLAVGSFYGSSFFRVGNPPHALRQEATADVGAAASSCAAYSKAELQIQAGWNQRERLVWLLLGFAVLALMLPVTAWLYRLLWPLQMIQFAWRFLAPGSLILAALIAVYWPKPNDHRTPRVLHALVLLVTAVMAVGMTWWAYRATCLAPQTRFGLAPALVNYTENDVAEYRPAGAHLEQARQQLGNAQFKVVEGSARVRIEEWRARRLGFQVQADDPVQVLLRQFYYPGWVAQTDTGAVQPLEADPATGVLSLRIPNGDHHVVVQLNAGRAEQAGWWITGLALVGCAGSWWLGRRRSLGTLTPANAGA